MMDSNQLTPEMVSKFINGLYKDTYPGFVKEFKVEVINHDRFYNDVKYTKGRHPDVIIHVLMDNEVYVNTGLPKHKAYLAVKDVESKLKGILNYLPYPYNLRIIKYINDSQTQDDVYYQNNNLQAFHFGGIKIWEDRTKNL